MNAIEPTVGHGAEADAAIIERLRRSVDRGVGWLEGQLADGGFRGAERELSAYYKSLVAFAICGRVEAGARAVARVRLDLLGPRAELSSGRGTAKTAIVRMARNLANYMDGWIALGAWLLEDRQLAEAVCQRLGEDQAEKHGGVLTGPPRWAGLPRYDLATAASCGRAFLAAGHRDRAYAAGDFLVGALEHQRELATGLDLSFDDRWQPLGAPDPSELTYYRYDLTKRGEKVWFPAFSAAFLCELHQVSGQARHLDAAVAYFDVIERSPEFADGTIANGKSGWAAGLLARETGNLRYHSILQTVAPNVLARQAADGQFYESAPAAEAPAPVPSDAAGMGRHLERTAEFTIWVAEFLRMLSLGPTA